jgi:integrase
MGKLTDAAVIRLKAGPKRQEIADSGTGLYLIIQPDPSKAKSWALRFRDKRKSFKVTLGRLDETGHETPETPVAGRPTQPLSLKAARALASDILRQRAAGRDPVAEAKRREAEVEDEKASVFGVLVRRYAAEQRRRKLRRWPLTARLLGLAYASNGEGEPSVLKGGLADRWRDRPVRSIGRADVRKVVNEAVRQAVPGLRARREPHAWAEPMGRSLHAALSSFLTWCVEDELIEANPCASTRRPPPAKARERTLTDAELAAVWRASASLAPQYMAMTRLLIATGARLREVTGLRWAELNDDLSLWTLPAARAKNGHEHRVPLTKLARAAVEATPRIAGPYVFTFSGRAPMEGFSKQKRKLDHLADVKDWCWHDLRRTCATGLQRVGARLEVIESVLNHVGGSRSGLVGTYQRFGFEPEKAAVLAAWAAHVEAVVAGQPAPSNVVELAGRRA